GFRRGGHLGGIGSLCGGPAERFARWNKGRFGWQRVCRRASVLLSLSRSSQAARDRSGAGAYDWSADMKRFTLMALLMAAAGVMVSGRSATQTPTAGGRLPEIEFVLSGFEVQLVYEVPLNEQGSWVSLGIGPDGSLYASDQGKTGTYRIRVGGTLDAPTAEVTRLPVAVSGAQGLVWAFDSLYANVNGTGLYRIRDTDGDNVPDTAEFLGVSDGGGEHGVHDVILTEDGKGLYYSAGNHMPQG